MKPHRMLKTYLTGAVIVWVGILLASAIILKGTDQFAQMLPVLTGGVVYFIVIVPPLLQRLRDQAPDR